LYLYLVLSSTVNTIIFKEGVHRPHYPLWGTKTALQGGELTTLSELIADRTSGGGRELETLKTRCPNYHQYILTNLERGSLYDEV
jgi:hypothetical protein